MQKDKLINYIKENDPFFRDADFTKYTYYELMIIKVSIEVEKAQKKNKTEEKKLGLSTN